MKPITLWTFTAITIITVAGCHKAESPATVERDVAHARDTAADQEAKAYDKAADTVNSTNQNMARGNAESGRKGGRCCLRRSDSESRW